MTGTETLTDPDAIRDALDTLAVGDVVRINERRPQRVTSTATMSVFVEGSWKNAATYELHLNQWGERPALHPTDMRRRIIEDPVEVSELTVERLTTLSAWL